MNTDSGQRAARSGRATWIAAGFLGAFAASVLTVIYTGLMVEGSRTEFDAGFRSVTLGTGEVRRIELYFDSPAPAADARLIVELPPVVVPAAGAAAGSIERSVEVEPGRNVFAIEVSGRAPGSGYLEARLVAGAPLALERVFVTVAAD